MRAILSVIMVLGLAVQGLTEERTPIPAVASGQEKTAPQGRPSTAEEYLSRLARTNRSRRVTMGIISSAIGASGVALGLQGLAEKSDPLGLDRLFGTFFVAAGGLSLAGAALSLALPSRAERAYTGLHEIQDSAARERTSAAALARLASSARTRRLIRVGLISAMAVAAVVAGDDGGPSDRIFSATCCGALALYSFLAKSREEKAYLGYLEGKGPKISPELCIGLAPHGGAWASLSLEF